MYGKYRINSFLIQLKRVSPVQSEGFNRLFLFLGAVKISERVENTSSAIHSE
jgi:hypothetical protein